VKTIFRWQDRGVVAGFFFNFKNDFDFQTKRRVPELTAGKGKDERKEWQKSNNTMKHSSFPRF
jgi:hypothetical protein